MAQRTGADGLIAPRAKTASAGILPALAVAALLALSGCGGGSGDSTQGTAAAGSQASGQEATGPADSFQSQPSSSSGSKAKTSPGSSDPPATQGNGGATKHGAQIKQPKGEPERAPSAAEKAESTLDSIALESPGLLAPSGSESQLPATYTCDGKDVPPDLRWHGVPAGTAELVLFVLGLEPVDEALFFNWVVAGLDPNLEGIEEGKLPEGAVTGKNGYGKDGYSICPPNGKPETYIFALYALPQRLSPQRGFDPTALRKQILGISGNVGLMAASYGR